METDMFLPPPIDDSLNHQQQPLQRLDEEIPPRKQVSFQMDEEPVMRQPQYYEPPQQYYYEPVPQYHQQLPPVQEQKKTDIFSELDRTHWIILACAMLLAFFMGKSMTPVIIRNT